MEKKEFSRIRHRFGKSQRQMARILGISPKAVQSFEQGWRNIPVHAERQLLFLVSRRYGPGGKTPACWKIKKCEPERRRRCPAWEFKSGNLCWFISGTLCQGEPQKNWEEKMKICRGCDVFKNAVPEL